MPGPLEAALGEHLKRWLDTIGGIQAANRNEDRAGKSFQVGGK